MRQRHTNLVTWLGFLRLRFGRDTAAGWKAQTDRVDAKNTALTAFTSNFMRTSKYDQHWGKARASTSFDIPQKSKYIRNCTPHFFRWYIRKDRGTEYGPKVLCREHCTTSTLSWLVGKFCYGSQPNVIFWIDESDLLYLELVLLRNPTLTFRMESSSINCKSTIFWMGARVLFGGRLERIRFCALILDFDEK